MDGFLRTFSTKIKEIEAHVVNEVRKLQSVNDALRSENSELQASLASDRLNGQRNQIEIEIHSHSESDVQSERQDEFQWERQASAECDVDTEEHAERTGDLGRVHPVRALRAKLKPQHPDVASEDSSENGAAQRSGESQRSLVQALMVAQRAAASARHATDNTDSTVSATSSGILSTAEDREVRIHLSDGQQDTVRRGQTSVTSGRTSGRTVRISGISRNTPYDFVSESSLGLATASAMIAPDTVSLTHRDQLRSNSGHLSRSNSGVSGISGMTGAPSEDSSVTPKSQFQINHVWPALMGKHSKLPKLSSKARMYAMEEDQSVRIASITEEVNDDWNVRFSKCCPPNKKCLAFWMVGSPLSTCSIALEAICVIFVFYDAVTVPLLAFEPERSMAPFGTPWPACFFWTAMILRRFCVGFIREDGGVEMDCYLIARNYLLSWCVFDVLLTSCDWVEAVMKEMEYAGAMRITRIRGLLRVMRMMRLARMLRMPNSLEHMFTFMHSESLFVLIGIAKVSLLFVYLVHVLGCSWYALGAHLNDDAPGWVRVYNLEGVSLTQKYFTCAHWGVTQFIGNMDMYPTTVPERIFACLILVLTFISTAGFVSRVTAHFTRLLLITEHREQLFTKFYSYLQQYRVSPKTSMHAIRNARHALKVQQQHCHEKDIELFGIISEVLRAEIHYQIRLPFLKKHAFFRCFNGLHPPAFKNLCHVGMNVLSMHDGDRLFAPGEEEEKPQVYFFMTGNLSYTLHAITLQEHEVKVSAGMWACEGALWMHWVHVGEMVAMSSCMTLALDAEAFQIICEQVQVQGYFAAVYADCFVNWMNENKHTQLSDLGNHTMTKSLTDMAIDRAQADSKGRFKNIARRLSISSDSSLT